MNMGCLIQEILLFHGNNQIGSLSLLPSHQQLECYKAEKSALDTIIDIITEHSRSSKE
jgi:hypothetical protein